MNGKYLASLVPAAVIAAGILLAPAPSVAQTKAKAAPTKTAPKADTYKAPRTPDGQPDLQGIWQASSTGTAFNIEPHTPSLGIQGGVGVIVDPADGKIPYKPEARAKQQENFKNRAKLDPINKCFMPGVPRLTYMPFPLQIVQVPDKVVMLSEYAHTTRNIFMKGEHLEGLELWMGDSRGKWDGDTLVVDVANFNADTWLDQSGNIHSEQLHVVERFTRTGPDTMTYEATLTDPKTYTRPFTIRLLLYRHQEPNYRLLEYDCNAYMEFEGGSK
jgi:hypothetical protein